ncbi:MAG: alanine racemase [Lachnospiraceae bacterium]|nr:alanine racemase [Lachnospiraceae bacterium]
MENKTECYGRGYIEVNLEHILSNAEEIKKHIGTKTQIVGVIKTDGYGHGSVALAKALEKLDCMYGFAVATEEEAMELIEAGVKLPVMILGYTFPYAYEEMAKHGIEPAVFRADMLSEMGKAALKMGKKMRVHVKVDTGMGRIGITPDEKGLQFVKQAVNTAGIELAGIFTHFARADEENKDSAKEQLKKFEDFITMVKAEGISGFLCHCSNSAAIMELPESHMDLVRSGIILYGLKPSDEVNMKALELRPALSFYSSIVYIKEMPKGAPISYGGTFVTPKEMRVATIPIGYGDGYPRSLSNKGYVLICGKKAPILGKVCMDQMMVDVTEIPDAKEGDKVTLIGKDGAEEITADFLGDLSGRFNYELICDLGKRIPRLYRGN